MILNNTPIDVICLIDKTGKLTPLKIQIECDDSSIITTKINEVVYYKENKYAGFTTYDYGCKVTICDVEKLIVLRYYVAEHTWRINKIIFG